MEFMKEAIKEAERGMKQKDGGPFGAVIVDKEGNIVAKGHNQVLSTNDPTAHAEISAIRTACQKLNTKNLSDYIIYSTCEPCPMCLSAIIWANIKTLYYGSTRQDAAKIGFKDEDIYDFLAGKNELLVKKDIKDEDCKNLFEKYNGEIY